MQMCTDYHRFQMKHCRCGPCSQVLHQLLMKSRSKHWLSSKPSWYHPCRRHISANCTCGLFKISKNSKSLLALPSRHVHFCNPDPPVLLSGLQIFLLQHGNRLENGNQLLGDNNHFSLLLQQRCSTGSQTKRQSRSDICPLFQCRLLQVCQFLGLLHSYRSSKRTALCWCSVCNVSSPWRAADDITGIRIIFCGIIWRHIWDNRCTHWIKFRQMVHNMYTLDTHWMARQPLPGTTFQLLQCNCPHSIHFAAKTWLVCRICQILQTSQVPQLDGFTNLLRQALLNRFLVSDRNLNTILREVHFWEDNMLLQNSSPECFRLFADPFDLINRHIHVCSCNQIVFIFQIICLPLGSCTKTGTCALFCNGLWRLVLLRAFRILNWPSHSLLLILTTINACVTTINIRSTSDFLRNSARWKRHTRTCMPGTVLIRCHWWGWHINWIAPCECCLSHSHQNPSWWAEILVS